jgi:hypothetical protein
MARFGCVVSMRIWILRFGAGMVFSVCPAFGDFLILSVPVFTCLLALPMLKPVH